MKISFLFIAILLFGCSNLKQVKATSETQSEPTVQKEVVEKVEEKEEATILNHRPVYRAARTIKTDLIHTKLEVKFDWSKSYLLGKATISAKPHFYPSDSLYLDAKGMEIKSVKIGEKPLLFDYSNDVIAIQLDKEYTNTEEYTVIIDYISKPEDRETG